MTFRELQERCDNASPTVVNRRLAELRRAGFVEHASGLGYRLTGEGWALLRSLKPFFRWAATWQPPDTRQPQGR
jgi:DNA-binding HxlR family transcriptional regulator